MTRLWWVRHGPTHAREMIGWTDRAADLSDHAAVARLRDHLPEAPVVSSDLCRATQTAAAISRSRPLPPLPALRDIHFGAWEGLRFTQAEARDPGREIRGPPAAFAAGSRSMPSQADMAQIRAFYATVTAKHPERFQNVRLREEDAPPAAPPSEGAEGDDASPRRPLVPAE